MRITVAREMVECVVWDFDWSMIDENSDTFIIKEVDPDTHSKMREKEFRERFPVWTDLMAECFRIVRQEKSCMKIHFEDNLIRIPFVRSFLTDNIK
jgi:hypothetical protein